MYSLKTIWNLLNSATFEKWYEKEFIPCIEYGTDDERNTVKNKLEEHLNRYSNHVPRSILKLFNTEIELVNEDKQLSFRGKVVAVKISMKDQDSFDIVFDHNKSEVATFVTTAFENVFYNPIFGRCILTT